MYGDVKNISREAASNRQMIGETAMRTGWCGLLAGVAALAVAAASMHSAIGGEALTEDNVTPRFSGTNVTHANAIVFDVDAERNSITLLEENGEAVDVVVDSGLRDVRKLKPGDSVAITYSRALLLRVDKANSSGIRERVDSGFTTAPTTGSSLSVHRVQGVATVLRIDLGNRQITLRGPTRTVTLEASSGSLLEGLKVGDSVRVDFAEATAIQISRGGVPLP